MDGVGERESLICKCVARAELLANIDLAVLKTVDCARAHLTSWFYLIKILEVAFGNAWPLTWVPLLGLYLPAGEFLEYFLILFTIGGILLKDLLRPYKL